MPRPDWRFWRFGQSSTALLSPRPRVSLTSCRRPSSLWVCSFLGVLQALLMVVFSSIIVFLCASLGPGAFCFVCNITRPAYMVNLSFTIAISASRCQSTRRLKIGSVFFFLNTMPRRDTLESPTSQCDTRHGVIGVRGKISSSTV